MKNNRHTEDKCGMKDAEKEIERLKEEIKKRDKQITTLKQKVRILLRDKETNDTVIVEVRKEAITAMRDIYKLASGENVCTVCAHKGFCSNEGMCNFEWHGAKRE